MKEIHLTFLAKLHNLFAKKQNSAVTIKALGLDEQFKFSIGDGWMKLHTILLCFLEPITN
jgi:hypothetical protein